MLQNTCSDRGSQPRNAAAGSQPRRPQTWPRHMYWHQQGSEWVPAMYVEWYEWDRASDQSAGDVAVKWCANQTRTAFISNIPPIALPKWGNWLTPSVDGTITLPNEVHHFIRRLNLLRYQFRSKVYWFHVGALFCMLFCTFWRAYVWSARCICTIMYQKSINTALGSSWAYVKCGSALWGRLMVNSSQITAQICNNLQKSVTKIAVAVTRSLWFGVGCY